jgi:hypothetical protein
MRFPNDPTDVLDLLRMEIASTRLELQRLHAQRLARKYSPEQPRVPAGNPDGGQWTDADGGL